MEKVVNLKFTQHPLLKDELLATGDAPLVEVSLLLSSSPATPFIMTSNGIQFFVIAFLFFSQAAAVDAFWGYGPDGKGKNELGKALVRLRKRFRDEER